MSYVLFDKQIISRKNLNFYEVERFRYADSFFESMYFDGHRFPLKQYHLERIQKTLAFFKAPEFHFPVYEFNKLLEVNNEMNNPCKIRLSFIREKGANYEPVSTKFHTLFEVEVNPNMFTPVKKLGIYETWKKEISPISSFKTGNALLYVLAKQYATENEFDDALLLNTHKQIIEATSSSLVIIKDKKYFTPKPNSGQVESTSLNFLKTIVPIDENDLAVEDVMSADEIFLCNALQMLKPVLALNGVQKKQEITQHTIEKVKEVLSLVE